MGDLEAPTLGGRSFHARSRYGYVENEFAPRGVFADSLTRPDFEEGLWCAIAQCFNQQAESLRRLAPARVIKMVP